MDHSRDLAQAGQSATAAGAVQVPFAGLGQLWLNAGSLCNITCAHCYMESSPENDRLSYLTVADVVPFLDQAPDLPEVVLTGGEPFMNPDIIEILRAVLAAGCLRSRAVEHSGRNRRHPGRGGGDPGLRDGADGGAAQGGGCAGGAGLSVPAL